MKSESSSVFDALRRQYRRAHTIADLTPTVCRLFGVPEPEECAGEVISAVADQADKLMEGEGLTERGVLFCADALGDVQREHFPADFAAIERVAGFRIPSISMKPSVTPVCYASIFSGAAPCAHGIMKYEKPVLGVDTLFDAFARAGRRVAILSVCNCSIDTIFRRRAVDYYSFHTQRPGDYTAADQLAVDFTRRFIAEDSYDLIVCYMTNYDHQMHHHGPYSPETTEQAHLAAERFAAIHEAMEGGWSGYNRLLAFVPDHGGHATDETHGGHGTELDDDMLLSHYYRIDEKR